MISPRKRKFTLRVAMEGIALIALTLGYLRLRYQENGLLGIYGDILFVCVIVMVVTTFLMLRAFF